MHLAEQQAAALQCGGSVKVFPEWGPLAREHSLCELHAYLQSLVLRPHYWDVVMKLRVSAGGEWRRVSCRRRRGVVLRVRHDERGWGSHRGAV